MSPSTCRLRRRRKPSRDIAESRVQERGACEASCGELPFLPPTAKHRTDVPREPLKMEANLPTRDRLIYRTLRFAELRQRADADCRRTEPRRSRSADYQRDAVNPASLDSLPSQACQALANSMQIV